MTTIARRDWWVGIAAIALAVLLHALVPRYDRHPSGTGWWLRSDRWTGRADLARWYQGEWRVGE